MSNNGYGYFTPPPSPDYYRVGPGISELQKLDPITLYNFLNISEDTRSIPIFTNKIWCLSGCDI